MKETIEIGSSPSDETCAYVGMDNYEVLAREECERFIALIRKKLGPEPEGARLFVKSNPHDFGTYLEVAVRFDDENKEATRYAYRCDAEAPTTWEG